MFEFIRNKETVVATVACNSADKYYVPFVFGLKVRRELRDLKIFCVYNRLRTSHPHTHTQHTHTGLFLLDRAKILFFFSFRHMFKGNPGCSYNFFFLVYSFKFRSLQIKQVNKHALSRDWFCTTGRCIK